MESITGQSYYKGRRKVTPNRGWLNLVHWKKGQSGNPKGAPKGKTMKEFARQYLEKLDDKERIEFLKDQTPEIIWRMAEGNPHSTSDEKHEIIIPTPIADVPQNDSVSEDIKTEEKD